MLIAVRIKISDEKKKNANCGQRCVCVSVAMTMTTTTTIHRSQTRLNVLKHEIYCFCVCILCTPISKYFKPIKVRFMTLDSPIHCIRLPCIAPPVFTKCKKGWLRTLCTLTILLCVFLCRRFLFLSLCRLPSAFIYLWEGVLLPDIIFYLARFSNAVTVGRRYLRAIILLRKYIDVIEIACRMTFLESQSFLFG